jgi:hypothetical protein
MKFVDSVICFPFKTSAKSFCFFYQTLHIVLPHDRLNASKAAQSVYSSLIELKSFEDYKLFNEGNKKIFSRVGELSAECELMFFQLFITRLDHE